MPRDTRHTFLEVAVIKELSKVTKHKIMVTWFTQNHMNKVVIGHLGTKLQFTNDLHR